METFNDPEIQRLLIEVTVALVFAVVTYVLRRREVGEAQAKRELMTTIETGAVDLLPRVQKITGQEVDAKTAAAVWATFKAIKGEIRDRAVPAIDRDAKRMFPK